jgi:type I restriction enzyme S subunit
LYYVWKSQKVTDRLSSFVQSVTRSHQRCEPAEITKIPWAWPTLNEQSCIADFLDRKTAEIDNLIAKKRRLLDLLAEKRTALITRAVTKGLNPDAPMKDSGIEWLGEIPAHWDVLAIKQVFDFQNNRRIPIAAAERRSLERTYPYYGASGIIDYVDDYIFDEDLMLVAEDGANLLSRSTPLAFVARGKYWVNNHAHILRNRFGLLDYWEMLLSVCDFTPFITGSAQPKLTKDRLGAIAIPCPPEKEQSDILKFLGPSFERDELARVLCKKAIERLEEYRSALITNAVTGQIKVA